MVLRGELQRVVDVERERRPVPLLLAEAEERLDAGAAVRAVDPGTVERHWNWAISGVSAKASRAPSKASTFTPLSTREVVIVVLRSRLWVLGTQSTSRSLLILVE